MKKIITIILVLISIQSIYAQQINCERNTKFGKVDICLPTINGYKECYLEPDVKKLADMTEVSVNTVLGFYLNNSIYEKKDSIGLISFDNYFKVYGTKQIKDYDADKSILNEMRKVLSGNFISKKWDEMEKEIDKIGLEVKVGVPTVIDSYSLTDKTFTYIMLARYEFEGSEPYTMAMTINGMLMNKRLVWMAYCLNYEGENTIIELKSNSNKILKELMAAN